MPYILLVKKCSKTDLLMVKLFHFPTFLHTSKHHTERSLTRRCGPRTFCCEAERKPFYLFFRLDIRGQLLPVSWLCLILWFSNTVWSAIEAGALWQGPTLMISKACKSSGCLSGCDFCCRPIIQPVEGMRTTVDEFPLLQYILSIE